MGSCGTLLTSESAICGHFRERDIDRGCDATLVDGDKTIKLMLNPAEDEQLSNAYNHTNGTRYGIQ